MPSTTLFQAIALSLQCLTLLAAVAAPAAGAQENATVRQRLTEFWGGEGQVRLWTTQASLNVSIPLAAVSEVRSATLELHGTHSIALLEGRSLLGVRFNNATIAQIPLTKDRPTFYYPVEIPPELWRSGFNTVEFFVAQHAVESCEDDDSAVLWTELDLYQSTLDVEIDRRYPAELAGLSALFNPGIGGQASALFLTPESVDEDSRTFTEALPRVAQALALRRQYRPLRARERSLLARAPETVLPLAEDGGLRRDAPLEGTAVAHYLNDGEDFHVIVASRDDLRGVVDAPTLDAIEGPYLALQELPAAGLPDADGGVARTYPAAHRLVVSGASDADVATAARALSLMLDPLQRGSELTVAGLRDAGPARDSTAVAGLQPGHEYRFSALGTPSRSFRGAGQFTTEVPLVLPADFYVNESAEADLYLDFGYAPELGPSSTLNVLVNGDIIGGIALDNPDGGAFYRYRLTVPARILRGGRNDIALEVNLTAPQIGLPCASARDDHLLFNLRDTSSIALPRAGRVTRQPDLSLFGRTAYPLTGQAAGQSAVIALGDRGLTGAALTLAARFAQAAGVVLEELSLSTDGTAPANASAGRLQLASIGDLTDPARDRLRLALGATQRTPYRLQNNVYNRVSSLAYGDDQAPLVTGGDLSLTRDLGDLAVLHAASDEGGTRLLLTAEDNATLRARVDDLVDPALWGQLDGDVFAWRSAKNAELIMRVEPVRVVGSEDSRWLSLRLWLTNNPWLWAGALVIVIAALSFLIYRLLRRRNEAISEDW